MNADFTQTDAAGRRVPITVDMGQLDEPHHSSCYRLYDMYQRAKGKKYAIGERLPALQPEWSILRTHAAEITRTAQPPTR